jgi:beta-phosphoglucomutase-like phosphatase (HAD superfamily)
MEVRSGMPIVEIVEKLNEQQGLPMPVDEVSQRKEELYLKAVPQLKAVPEVLRCIESNYRKIPFAVVSGRTRDSVVASLTALNLWSDLMYWCALESMPKVSLTRKGF